MSHSSKFGGLNFSRTPSQSSWKNLVVTGNAQKILHSPDRSRTVRTQSAGGRRQSGCLQTPAGSDSTGGGRGSSGRSHEGCGNRARPWGQDLHRGARPLRPRRTWPANRGARLAAATQNQPPQSGRVDGSPFDSGLLRRSAHGRSLWTLKLPGAHGVALGLVESVNPRTIGRVLKKRAERLRWSAN